MKLKHLLFVLFLFTAVNISAAQEDKEARRKAFINDFLEYYREAYQKEQIEYLRIFFSSDALMITETKQLSKVGKEIAPNSTKARPYKLLVENRETYLSKLKEVFDKNNGINIGISKILIRKHPKYPDIYGVYFSQIWDDSGTMKNLENQMPGYIFLMLDFKNSEMTPIMHVRTWQPQSNITKPSDKYSLEDFRIISYK